MKRLSDKQKLVLNLLKESRDNPLKLREMSAILGVPMNSLQFNIVSLISKGYIKATEKKRVYIFLEEMPSVEERKAEIRKQAVEAIGLTVSFTPEQRALAGTWISKLEELAGYILEIT